jgi:hypothetical protein
MLLVRRQVNHGFFKLPRLDSNQDKESQKVFLPQHKLHVGRTLGNDAVPFVAGLRENPDTTTDLQRLLAAWPTLPEVLRAGILAMIDAARKEG